MLRPLFERIRQKHQTLSFPAEPPSLPERFRGLPLIDSSSCPAGCEACAANCPAQAVRIGPDGPEIDQGLCLYCPECPGICPDRLISFSHEYRLAVRRRLDLIAKAGKTHAMAEPLDAPIRSVFGRSLKLRQISAGGCNACEADTNVLGTLAWDLGRFGIQFVASPRHADGILVTGPVTENMREALLKTWEAVPAPKIVIACGACAIAGGPFRNHQEVHNGVTEIIPVDLFIPGCPPHPSTILDGLLRLLGRVD